MNITIETPLNQVTGRPQTSCRIIEVTKDRGEEGIFSTKILIGLQNRRLNVNEIPTINIQTSNIYLYEASIVLGIDFMLTRFRILKNRFGRDGYYNDVYRAVTRVSNYISEDFRLSSHEEEHQLILMINRAISEITDMAIFFTRDGYFMSERDWYIKGYRALVPRRNLKKLNFS